MDVDAARTGGLPFVFEPGMGFERYVDYAMDVPMYFVYRKGQYINALGMSWRDFMEVRRSGGWGGAALVGGAALSLVVCSCVVGCAGFTILRL
jgi:gamma-glutamylcysteine synthetase